jgi:ribosomal-protein-alanine N-acetyltransferase
MPVPNAPSHDDWRSGLPDLAGPTVTVREVASTDAGALFELLADPVVTQHISSPPPSADAFSGFIAWAKRERSLGHGVCFGIVPHGLDQAVGVVQVRALDPAFFVAEWGFALGAAFWSTGVFQEAATLIAQFAFTTLKVHRLEARAVSHNGRGIGALQKIGATVEAVLSKGFKKAVGYDEQLLWTVIATEWKGTARERYSASEAKARIAQAVAATRRCGAYADRRPPALYPFFVTDRRLAPTGPSCPRCGAPLTQGPCPTCH